MALLVAQSVQGHGLQPAFCLGARPSLPTAALGPKILRVGANQ